MEEEGEKEDGGSNHSEREQAEEGGVEAATLTLTNNILFLTTLWLALTATEALKQTMSGSSKLNENWTK